MNHQLIAQLRSGEIAAENNGTLEQLREVLKAAFPGEYKKVYGDWKYYGKWRHTWGPCPSKDLPTVPITDFFKEDRAVELLREARIQIEYLHEKFTGTATGNSMLSRIDTFLNELNK